MLAAVCTRYGAPEVLQLAEIEPPRLKPDGVRIKIRASAVTSSDCFIRAFRVKPALWIPGRLVLGITRPRKPVLGMALAGEIDAVGAEVTSFEVGQPVFGFDRFGFGTYAQYKCMPAGGVLASKPANLSYEQAAAIPYGFLLARHFLKDSIRGGQKVLVYGASGAVGTAAVQLAKCDGAQVTAVCGPGNVDLVRSLGAETVIDYTKDDVRRTNERYDLVFVAVGDRVGPPSAKDCRGLLTPDGRYRAVDHGRPVLSAGDLMLLKRLAEAGELTPVIDRCYPLAEVAEAHRYVEGGHTRGNVVVTVPPGDR